MDFIIELILELAIEGSLAIGTNKKISRWIRYPLLFLLAIFYICILGVIAVAGIKILDSNFILGIVFLIFDFVFSAVLITKFIKKGKRLS